MDHSLRHLQILLIRDLRGVRAEIEAFPNDELVWECPESISNSAGVLAMHVCGNLKHYIGHVLGGTDYVRNRPLEFSVQPLSRSEICLEVDSTISVLESVVPTIDGTKLSKNFPEKVGGHLLNTHSFLMHLGTHLSFHLGQLGYLRRILSGTNSSTNPVALADLGLEE